MDYIGIWNTILFFSMIVLGLTILFCLGLAIRGPKFTDRILGINVINVKVIVLICILGSYYQKSYLIDIALIYASISFLSVIVLSRLFREEDLSLGKEGENGNN